MKDSIGSTLLLKIFTVFLVVYIIFMASILNYTKTFRVKNQIINIINRHGGYTDEAKNEINNYFSKSTIYGSCTELSGNAKFGEDESNRCEIKAYSMESPVSGSYYKVRLYVTFMFPLIKQTLRIPITGETKILYKLAPPGDQKAQYTIVDRDPPPDTLYKFDIKTCTPPDNPPSIPVGTCCSVATCSHGVLVKKDGACACYTNTAATVKVGNTTYRSNGVGRVRSTDGCSYCATSKTCPNTITYSEKTNTSSTAAVQFVYTITDNSRNGLLGCQITVKGKTFAGRFSESSSTFGVTFAVKSCDVGESATAATLKCTRYDGTVVLNETKTINLSKPSCCVSNCTSCKPNNPNFCLTCASGYVLNSAGSCVANNCNVANCATCYNNNPSKCSTCNTGYIKNSDNTVCLSCDSSCKTTKLYNNKCICSSCNTGKVASSSSQKCCTIIAGCIKYSDFNCNCTKCDDGYELRSGSCTGTHGGSGGKF